MIIDPGEWEKGGEVDYPGVDFRVLVLPQRRKLLRGKSDEICRQAMKFSLPKNLPVPFQRVLINFSLRDEVFPDENFSRRKILPHEVSF